MVIRSNTVIIHQEKKKKNTLSRAVHDCEQIACLPTWCLLIHNGLKFSRPCHTEMDFTAVMKSETLGHSAFLYNLISVLAFLVLCTKSWHSEECLDKMPCSECTMNKLFWTDFDTL